MKLKEALSQIRPTDEQSEKIYGDILNKLSEVPPKEKEETNAVMKKRKIVMSVIAAAAAVVIAGGSVYAVSPDVREAVKNLLGINRTSVNDYYEIAKNIDEIDPNQPLPQADETAAENTKTNDTGISKADILGDSLTVTENDYKEFSEGVYVKLIGAVNCGDYAEILTEWRFDDPCIYGEYSLSDFNISTFPGYISHFGGGGGLYPDDHRMLNSVTVYFSKDIPEDMKFTMEVTSLYKSDSENSIDIDGYFSADFTIGKPIRSCTIDMEPTKISWSHPYMMGAVAEMEMSGISYSPKAVKINLRMLNNCIVKWHGYRNYYNSTSMFCHFGGDSQHILDYKTDPDDYIALKFKMSDGTLKCANFSGAHSDRNIIDTDTVINDDEDWDIASNDIPRDKPAVVTFSMEDVVDYTNVEAIVFCGKEIPITEKDFGLELAPVDTEPATTTPAE